MTHGNAMKNRDSFRIATWIWSWIRQGSVRKYEGNAREGKAAGAFIGLVPMLAIYMKHLCLSDVSSRDRSNNTRVLRQRIRER